MSFKMIYDKRNRDNIANLADNTKQKTLQLYQYCIDNKIQILIYETIRTKSTQAEYVKQGKSKTMNSWHLTGQALDWVLVDSKGTALWNGYKTTNGLKVINYAKSIGFTSGHDWGWDSPHLQYDKIKYGKDTFGKVKPSEPSKHMVSSPTPPSNTKPKERVIKLLKDSTSQTLRNEFVKDLEKAYADKVFTDKKWIELAKSGELTLADAFLLQNRINKK